jgi:peptide/nickel transport system substrate-binding protein
MRAARCLLFLGMLVACAGPGRRGATVLYASGADLQSINPLLTLHPLARQVQRYALLTTLVQYDSLLQPIPYLARRWRWDDGGRRLTFTLSREVRWHDGVPTTARDAAFTLERALDPATGYPRRGDLAFLLGVSAPDDTTLVLRLTAPRATIPDVLTDLAILPYHLLDSVPPARFRQAAWNEAPVGNGPFRFVAHEANRRWVFARNPEFPAELGGPPLIERLVIAVVDEPMTKLAALSSGELDFAGIQPAHAEFVRRDPSLAVVEYPVLFTTGLVFNARVAPFADPAARRRVSVALDREALVQGFAFGFAEPATGPVPRGVRGYVEPPPQATPPPSSAPLRFELLTVGSGEAALEQMIQAQLAAHGIAVTIRPLELSAFLARVYGPDHGFQAALLGTPGDLDLGYLAPLAALTGLPAPASPEALQRFFADSAAVAFLYHSRGVSGRNRRMGGVQMDLRGELATLTRWTVSP